MQGRIVLRISERKHCISGIAESPGCNDAAKINSGLPTTHDLKKARRLAERSRKSVCCSECSRASCKCRNQRIYNNVRKSASKNCVYQEMVLSRPIHRPVTFGVTLLDFAEGRFPEVQLNGRWASQTIRCFWSMGFKLSTFIRFFEAVPLSMTMPMADMLVALDALNRCKLIKNPRCIGTEENGGIETTADEAGSAEYRAQMQAAADMWEMDEIHGFLQVAYEPATMERRHLVMTSRFASLCGFHKEELLARYAAHDAELLFPELDGLAILVDDCRRLFRAPATTHERYLRIRVGDSRGPGGERHGLVWVSASKALNRLGQLEKWTVIMRAVSPEEYDAAVRHRPTQCPLHVAGDPRTGSQLLGFHDCRPYDDLDWGVVAVTRAPPHSPAAAAMRRLVAAVEEMAREARSLCV